MPLSDVKWDKPVVVRLQCGLERRFIGPYEALDFLENEWPLRRGVWHERALNICEQAMVGVVPAILARRAFVQACLEAHMPILSPDRDVGSPSHQPQQMGGSARR